MHIDPRSISSQDTYKLMVGSVVPRPIAWISSQARDGTLNLAPFSFFIAVSPDPPTIAIAVGFRGGSPKDTRHNIEATGEFVVNVVTEEVAEAMNLTSGNYEPHVSEFAVAGVTAAPSVVVAPPRVAESPISMECRLSQIVPVGAPPAGYGLILGEIVYWHVRDDLYHHGRIDLQALHAIGRLAGNGYARTRDQFEMLRPP